MFWRKIIGTNTICSMTGRGFTPGTYQRVQPKTYSKMINQTQSTRGNSSWTLEYSPPSLIYSVLEYQLSIIPCSRSGSVFHRHLESPKSPKSAKRIVEFRIYCVSHAFNPTLESRVDKLSIICLSKATNTVSDQRHQESLHRMSYGSS